MDKKIICLSIVLVGAVLFLLGCTGSPSNEDVELSETSTQMMIPLSGITNEAKFFEFESNGAKIKFFVLKAVDGSIKTAFDACDVCFSAKKGYRQEGEYMVCNNCGNKYRITSLGTENRNSGGCWPGYLPNTIEGNNLVINKSDLENGRYRFA